MKPGEFGALTMNTTRWAFALIFMLLLSSAPLFAEDAPPNPPPAPAPVKADDKKPAAKFANPIPGKCVVSPEDDLDENITAEYKGKSYAFCCKGCKKKFEKDPESFLTKK
jgi:hypothetical protein